MSDSHHEDGYHVHAHITPVKVNLAVLGALFFFTALTVAAYNVRLGDANLFVAIFIATIKATIVGTFFMHLKYEDPFNTIFFVGSVAFLVLFLGYTVNDTAHRNEVTAHWGARVDPGTGEWANGVADNVQNGGEVTPVDEWLSPEGRACLEYMREHDEPTCPEEMGHGGHGGEHAEGGEEH